MSLLLADTTFLIDVERGGLTLDPLIDDDDHVAIAAVTVADLLVGVQLVSGKRREARRAYVDEVLATLPVIAYDHASPWSMPRCWWRCGSRAILAGPTTS